MRSLTERRFKAYYLGARKGLDHIRAGEVMLAYAESRGVSRGVALAWAMGIEAELKPCDYYRERVDGIGGVKDQQGIPRG